MKNMLDLLLKFLKIIKIVYYMSDWFHFERQPIGSDYFLALGLISSFWRVIKSIHKNPDSVEDTLEFS